MNTERNPLFPVFIKLHQVNTLIVGGGEVALEKLTNILKSSPDAKLTVVGTEVSNEIFEISFEKPNVQVFQQPFHPEDLEGKQLVILATDNRQLHEEIKKLTEVKGILTNVADTPELCDFYLGSIVTKGDLKIGISTNGKSPTLAKRMRQYLEETLPEETQTLLNNLNAIRDTIKGGFAEKVKQLNELTQTLVNRQN